MKAFCIELHASKPEDSHDLGLSHSQEAIRSEPINDYTMGYADNRGLSYLPTSVWGYKCQAKLPIWSYHNTGVGRGWMPMPNETYKRMHSWNKRQGGDKLFVTRGMDPAVTVSNGTIASWLKETLTLAFISTSGGSIRKPAATYAASQGALNRVIMEAGDWAHTYMIYGYYIRCLPKEVLVRILEQTSASIQGVNVAKIATDNLHWCLHYAGRLGLQQSHLQTTNKSSTGLN